MGTLKNRVMTNKYEYIFNKLTALRPVYKFFDLNMISMDSNMTAKVNNINFFKLKWKGVVLYGLKFIRLHPCLRSLRTVKQKVLGI